MDTTFLDNCRMYVSTSAKLVELARQGNEARDAWIKKAEEAMGYKEDELAIMITKGNLWLYGLRVSPIEEGWRKKDNLWVPRMSSKLGKAINAKIMELGIHLNHCNAWLEENGMKFETCILLGGCQIMNVQVEIGATEDHSAFVWFVPLLAGHIIHQRVVEEFGGVEITTGMYLDKYRNYEYRMW